MRSRWDATSTAAEVVEGVDLRGRRVVITGGSGGLGAETARCLAGAGAEVTLAVRSLEAGRSAAAAIGRRTPGAAVDVRPLDLADLASVARFASAWEGPLHVLVANAGVMRLPERSLGTSGWEAHLAVNHLGHLALATGLHRALAAASGARIVVVSSRAHMRSRFHFDDPHFEHRPYDPQLAYGQSKTANVLFAVEAGRRWASEGITANALHPGTVVDTDIGRHMAASTKEALRQSGLYTFKSIEQGAATSTFLAASPSLDGITGRYFEDVNEAEVVAGRPEELLDVGRGVAAYALDAEAARRLWERSVAALS